MATASLRDSLEEELTCSVCLQIYTDPVILGCKHSFCRGCIEEQRRTPGQGESRLCPVCRAPYSITHRLESNFHLANIVDRYLSPDTSPGTTACNYCIKTPLPAVKTCLKCEASMCHIHLQPHTANSALSNHPLVEPGADISAWKCLEHQEILKFCCKDDDMCVCTVCILVGKHRNHNCVPIAEGVKEIKIELRSNLEKIRETTDSLKASMEALNKRKFDIQRTTDAIKQSTKERYDAIKKYADTIREITERAQDEEKSCMVLRVESEIREVDKKMQLCKTTADIINSLLAKPADLSFIQAYRAECERRSLDVDLVPCLQVPPDEDNKKLASLRNCCHELCQMISKRDRKVFIILYGKTPALDPNTAHVSLILSNSGRTVQFSGSRQPYPESLERFDCFLQVLGTEGISNGCSYWETEIRGEGHWRIGVCYKSIKRKGGSSDSLLGCNKTSWCLSRIRSYVVQHNACAGKMHTSLSLPAVYLSTVGVLVDFSGGMIAFYSVSDSNLILLHTFNHIFTEPLYPALSVCSTDTSLTLRILQ